MRAMEESIVGRRVTLQEPVVKVRKTHWRKGFPGAQVGKTSSSCQGKEGLEEYLRERVIWGYGPSREREGEGWWKCLKKS